ncbi:MAG: hypothetical protein AAF732_04720 [Pseudomonadota bacterium]
MTERFTDEVLMAYADGRIDADTARAVESYLRNDPEARDFVASLRRTAPILAAAVNAPMEEEPPAHLVDLIRNAPTPDTTEDTSSAKSSWAASNVVPLFKRGSPIRHSLLPLAACVTLTAGIALGMYVRDMMHGHGAAGTIAIGVVPEDSKLAEVLETRASGTVVDVSSDASATVVATFRDRQGRACREFELLSKQTETDTVAADQYPVAAAVACRETPRAWRIIGAFRIGNKADDDTSDFVPSGANEADALKALIATIGVSTMLSPDAEARLLSSGWTRPVQRRSNPDSDLL